MTLASDEKGQFSYAFIFLIIMMSLMFLLMFTVPFLQFFNIGMYNGMETIVDLSLATANDINDPAIRAELVTTIEQQQINMLASNQVTANLIGFSGIFITLIVAFVFYLISRRNVQAGQLG